VKKKTWSIPDYIQSGNDYQILLKVVVGSGEAISGAFAITDAENATVPSIINETASGICGDCDLQTNNGLLFTLSGNTSVLNMLVCNANASEQECRASAEKGIDKPLICEAFLESSCSVKCFNLRGAYYVLVDGFSGLFDSVTIKDPETFGYVYQCPELAVDRVLQIKENLLRLESKVNLIITKLEILNETAENPEEKAKWELFLKTFGEIKMMISGHIAYIDEVLADTTPEKVEEVLQFTQELKQSIIEKLRSLS
jgi:hypothetical protein